MMRCLLHHDNTSAEKRSSTISYTETKKSIEGREDGIQLMRDRDMRFIAP